MANPLMLENVWLQQQKFEDAERLYRQLQAGTSAASSSTSLAGEIALARQEIQKTLDKVPVGGGSASGGAADAGVMKRLAAAEKRLDALEKENKELRQIISKLNQVSVSNPSSKPAAPTAVKDDDDDDDDDFDMFGDDDDEDDEEAEAVRKQRLKEYAEKKSKKPAVIAKSSVVLDVKPWDDETDMAEMERHVRTIEQDGLLWGTSKLAEVGYGIKKLVIMCVVEDLKVSIDDLTEKIADDFADHVQSVDIAAFSKI